MKITYRIPSKKVPYGYIEIDWERTDGGGIPDPAELAEEYAQYILDYQAAEVQAFENPAARQIKKADKVDKTVDDAQKILNEGLGGVTEVCEHKFVYGDDGKGHSGSVCVKCGEPEDDDPAAPWNDTSDNTETKKTQSSDDDWDFN